MLQPPLQLEVVRAAFNGAGGRLGAVASPAREGVCRPRHHLLRESVEGGAKERVDAASVEKIDFVGEGAEAAVLVDEHRVGACEQFREHGLYVQRTEEVVVVTPKCERRVAAS